MPEINNYVKSFRKINETSSIEKQAKQIEEEQKKNENKKQQQVVVETKTLVCVKTDIKTDYNLETTESFTYNTNKEIVESKIQEKYTFNDIKSEETTETKENVETKEETNLENNTESDKSADSKIIEKTKFEEITEICKNATDIINKDGFEFSCINLNNNITLGYEFNLEVFKNFTSTIGEIKSNATYKENIDTVKNKLTSLGYSCK